MRAPEAVAAELAAPLEYAQRVESVVAALGIETLMPRHDDRVDRFLAVWTNDELGHARALAELMRHIGVPVTDVHDQPTPVHNHVVGVLAQASVGLHRIIEAVWSTAGAMNEHLAMAAYTHMDAMLVARGERALHETLFRTLRSHESAHKSFYAAYAGDVLATMRPWQRRLARLVVQHTYMPVGAGGKADRPALGRTVRILAGDEWDDLIASPVQKVAERLLNEGEVMDPFVRAAVLRCLDADVDGEPRAAA
ncbi:hypothetical protein BH24ACT5_BH24ACT5_11030 [soil metagenome]